MANVPKTEVQDRSPAVVARTAAQEDERALVRRAQAGEVAAYEQLLAKHQQRVFAVVGGILRRREDTEDVAQQVFVKAYFSLKRFDLRSRSEPGCTRSRSTNAGITFARKRSGGWFMKPT